jgi:hypothetical protein
MVLAPFSSDRDGEIVHGVRLQIASTAPSIPIADRRSNISALRGNSRASVERFMMFSPLARFDRDQHGISSSRSAGNLRRRSKCRSRERGNPQTLERRHESSWRRLFEESDFSQRA